MILFYLLKEKIMERRRRTTKEDLYFIISNGNLEVSEIAEIRNLSRPQVSEKKHMICCEIMNKMNDGETVDFKPSVVQELKNHWRDKIQPIIDENEASIIGDMATAIRLISVYETAFKIITAAFPQNKRPDEEYSFCVIHDEWNQLYTVNRFGLSDEEIGGKVLFESKNKEEALAEEKKIRVFE